MKSATPIAAAVIVAAFTPGMASGAPAQPTGQACFLARNIDNFAPVDETTVNIRAGLKQYFQLKLFAPCQDIDFAQRVELRTRGSSWICAGQANDLELSTHATALRQRCLVTTVRELDAGEVAALPKNQKP